MFRILVILFTVIMRLTITVEDSTIANNNISTNSIGLNSCIDVDSTSIDIPSHLMTNLIPTKFSLTANGLNCDDENRMKTYTTSYTEIPTIKPTFQFQQDGYLKIGSSAHAIYYGINQYCLKGVTEDTNLEVMTCGIEACTPETPCIRKCCPLEEYFDLEKPGCSRYASTDQKWSPKLFANPSDSSSEINLKTSSTILPWFRLMAPKAWQRYCLNKSLILNYKDPESNSVVGMTYRMSQSGRINYWNSNEREWKELDSDFYCVDGYKMTNKSKELDQLLFTCPLVLPEERTASTYFGILCICTSFFSLLTVVVYIILREKQGNIHSWTIMSHAASITVFFVFLGFAHLTREVTWIQNSVFCSLAGTLAHIFFLSTFAWLLMISFDLYLTFRLMSVTKSKHIQRFMLYSLFAWGCPFLIVTVAWILQIRYGDDDTSSVKVPMYGVDLCYINPYAILEYVYIPCGILLSLNLLFFTMTTWKLIQIRKTTRFATQSMQKDRQSFTLFLKLFIVVGALWIIEFVNTYFFGTNVTWFVQATDSLNLLQPVAIFIIFTCKRDILKSLMAEKPCLKPILTPVLKILACCEGKQLSPQDSSRLNSSISKADTTMSTLSVSSVEEDTV